MTRMFDPACWPFDSHLDSAGRFLIIEKHFPQAWSSALMYGDFEGLELNERLKILHFQYVHKLCCAQSMEDVEEGSCTLGLAKFVWLVPQEEKLKHAA
mgnify:CR=1 FL=1